MYVNYTNPRLNPHRHYVYLRHKDDDILLIAVNFGDEQADIAVNIPAHAFNTLDTPQGTDPGARDLLTGATAPMTLSACGTHRAGPRRGHLAPLGQGHEAAGPRLPEKARPLRKSRRSEDPRNQEISPHQK